MSQDVGMLGCGDFCRSSRNQGGPGLMAKTADPIRPKDRNQQAAGIGAVFGVDATGAVFFNTAVAGSSCEDAEKEGKLYKGDVLVRVSDHKVYRAPLSSVASKLLGKPGTTVEVTFMREDQYVTMNLERRLTDMKAAKQAVYQAKVESGLPTDSTPDQAANGAVAGGSFPQRQSGTPQRPAGSPQNAIGSETKSPDKKHQSFDSKTPDRKNASLDKKKLSFE